MNGSRKKLIEKRLRGNNYTSYRIRLFLFPLALEATYDNLGNGPRSYNCRDTKFEPNQLTGFYAQMADSITFAHNITTRMQ